MTTTPHNYHWMIGLWCDGPLIDLEGELDTQLSIDLLGRRYLSESICYFDLKADYRTYSQATSDDCARMARAFLLYILGVYLFTNEGKMVSLKWLALFHDFGQTWESN